MGSVTSRNAWEMPKPDGLSELQQNSKVTTEGARSPLLAAPVAKKHRFAAKGTKHWEADLAPSNFSLTLLKPPENRGFISRASSFAYGDRAEGRRCVVVVLLAELGAADSFSPLQRPY